jgi:hypothetical protein
MPVKMFLTFKVTTIPARPLNLNHFFTLSQALFIYKHFIDTLCSMGY